MVKRNDIVVEIFNGQDFVGWFPEPSFSQALVRIHAYEGGKQMKDLRFSYLIFQCGGGKFHRYEGDHGYSFVTAINVKGKLKSHEFMVR